MSSASRKNLSIEELKEIVSPIAERHEVDRIYLFGSRARGDGTGKSDYDLYVEASKIKSLFGITELRLDLTDAIGHKVDIVTTKRLDPEFEENLMKERVMIYG